MIILGIDPGLVSGALAVVRSDGTASCADMPVIGEGTTEEVNALALERIIIRWKPNHCYIERAQFFPGQGGSSAFKYGGSYFAVRAVLSLCYVPITAVSAAVWKKSYGLKGGKGKLQRVAKEAARQRAIQLYPDMAHALDRVMDHGRAEALLIARFGLTAPGGLASAALRHTG